MSQVIGYRALMRDGSAGYGPTPQGAVRALKRAAPELRVRDRTSETILLGRHPDYVEIAAPEPKRLVLL